MVNCPKWVIAYDHWLCKVMSKKGDELLVRYEGMPKTIRTDTHGKLIGVDEDFVKVKIEDCQPITDEVADIMRGV